jgi:3-deoxy-D-manno-octulosonic-acid transferase
MKRLIYTLLLLLASPVVLVRLWWRGRHEAGYRKHIAERFGRYSQPGLENCIWIHAVSVGEVRAAAPLLTALKLRYPKRAILLTCMTVTGRATAQSLFAEDATICYLPYDFPWTLRRLLVRFKPSILLVMETEIWFNLVHVCAEARVPALLVNARLSERSREGYAKWAFVRTLVGEALGKLNHVAAQSKADAERLASLGATNIEITGNMKFDVTVDQERVSLGETWNKSVASTRKVLLAASTREGEEALLLAAYQRAFDAQAWRHVLLVIVPRHPARFDEVAALIEASGLSYRRRSETSSPENMNADVWLGDSMGEMFAYYAMCDLAFVGGSLVPAGGQNLIEPCVLGKPVLMGPSTFNFAEVSAAAVEAGAMQILQDADEVMAAAKRLLADAAERKIIGEKALTFAAAHRGATQKTMALIAPLLR